MVKRKDYLGCLTKKGISPLIATVLLIGFAIALAAIFYDWSGSLSKELTEETSYELASGIQCTKSSNLVVEDACILGNSINIKTTNKADGSLAGLIVRTVNSKNEVGQTDNTLEIGPFQTVNVRGRFEGIPQDIKDQTITLIPKISVSGKIEVCPPKSFKFTNGLCKNSLEYSSFEGIETAVLINSGGSTIGHWVNHTLNSGNIEDSDFTFGSRSIKVNPIPEYVYQQIDLDPTKTYNLTAWIKKSDSGTAYIKIIDSACTHQSESISASADWKFISLTFQNCDNPEIQLKNTADSALFDLVQVFPV